MADEVDKKAVGVEVKPLLKANKTVTGDALKYPDKPEMSSAIVTSSPAGTPTFTHPVVTFVYVLQGDADLHIGDKLLHYKAGDAWIEPIDTLNQLFNAGSAPLKNLVIFVDSEGKPNSIAAE